uniref:Secreted protein n=1 Tax=Aegilops tauschii subsp. strangulata TaxID=200361 RepID=A0A453AQD5_AEGTS
MFFRRWKAALRSISPLGFLGFARLISTSGVDYQGACRRIWCPLELLFHPCSSFYPYIHYQDSS